MIITANNAELRADKLRRTQPTRIVVDDEKPELRRFAFDPYREAMRHREEIVAAALTIARAWWLARDTEDGCRIRLKTLGSFEEWADLVAGAVEWLSGQNPINLIEERKAQDPMRSAEAGVIAALHDHFDERTWTAKEALDDLPTDTWEAVIRYRERPTAHQVGIWLRRRKDRVFGPLQLTGQVDRDGIVEWQLRMVGPPPQGFDPQGNSSPEQDRGAGSGWGIAGISTRPVQNLSENDQSLLDDGNLTVSRRGVIIPRDPPSPTF